MGLSPSKVSHSREIWLADLVSNLTTSLTLFRTKIRLALLPFRSLLLGESLVCFLFLPVLRCFNSRRYLSLRNVKTCFTFGDLGFNACMQLAQAYRSLPRPSSLFKPSYPSNSIIVESIFLKPHLLCGKQNWSISSVFIEYKLSNSFRDSRSRRSLFDCYFFNSFSSNFIF